ncbi:hypothetical protein BCR33DRAFT_723228 [Rhizoclosmatium globosum]|uniref:BHLH domain-containing protein n=1 Tax=Rhizoclosmatium globosum TaxID=329046 RepID=A0A1Y2BFI4_9FUNG|nr:hypothetical protein BCR33DRAFT_723228 [Rhizoclosmatium globosum]|eukprot:ORY33247.1 hypothetical protein BCR33DRAFT_723228 [Rhizoclosmatium globosum]
MFEFGDPSQNHSDSIVHPRPRAQFNSPMLSPFGNHASPLFQPLPHRSFSPHPYAPAVPSPLQTERVTPHHPHNRVTPLSLNMALQPPQSYPTLSNTPTHQLHMQNPFPSPVFNTYRDNLLESPALSAYSPSLAPGNSSTPMTGPNVFGNDSTIMTPFSSFQNSGGYAPDNGYWDASGSFNSLRLSEGSASSNCSTSSLTPPTIPSMPVVALSKNAIRVTPSKLFNRKPTVGRKPSLTNKSEEHRRMRKEAEKMRRDAMRDCVEELRSIIPPIAHMSDRFAPKEKVLEKALDFIGVLQNEHAQKMEMISELELEIAQTKKLLYGA